jgi:hypothetical protein
MQGGLLLTTARPAAEFEHRKFRLVDNLFAPENSPLRYVTDLVFRPINRDVLFSAIVCLAYVPFIKVSFSGEHSLWLSIVEGFPQILLTALILLFAATAQISFKFDEILALLAVFFIGLSQLAALLHSPADHKNFIMPAAFPFLLLTGPLIVSLSRRLGIQSRGEYVARVAKLVLVVMSIECAIRYLCSPFIHTAQNLTTYGVSVVDEGWFYRYKQSAIFGDANSTGIALLCLIAILLVFREHVGRRHLALAYILMFATFSRASIVAALFQYLIYKLWRWRRWIVWAIAICSPFVLYGLFVWYLNSGTDALHAADGSFVSKLFILQQMTNIYSQADVFQRLVGIGSGNTEYLAGMAAHNVIVVFVLELGFVGSALLVLYVWSLARRSPQAFFLLIVPMMINASSLFLTTMPYFYVTLGLLGSVTASRPWRSNVKNQTHRLMQMESHES